MKTKWFIYLVVTLFSIGFVACGDDDDDNAGAISEYVGTWSCTSPDSWESSTIVTEGTILLITSSGDMTWTLPDNSKYNAKMRALGDGWADITYNGKTYYKAEVYVSNNNLFINVNGAASLKVKDFPFDGSYIKVK